MDKVLGARQGIFAARLPQRKGSCACSGRCPLFSRLWLHLENSRSSVQLVFVRQEQEPSDAFRLHPDAGLSEESLTESETRNKRYCKAVTLKLPRSDIESDLEETQSLLMFHQQDLEEERSSRSLCVWFAAESEKQHLSWQSKSTCPAVKCLLLEIRHLYNLPCLAEHLIRGTVAAGRPASEDGDRSSDSGRSVSSCSLGTRKASALLGTSAGTCTVQHMSYTTVSAFCQP